MYTNTFIDIRYDTIHTAYLQLTRIICMYACVLTTRIRLYTYIYIHEYVYFMCMYVFMHVYDIEVIQLENIYLHIHACIDRRYDTDHKAYV